MALADHAGFGHKVVMHIRHLLVASVIALSACAAPPPAAPPPAPAPKPVDVSPIQTSQEPAGEWVDWPLAQGDWVYRQDERGSIALFGVSGANALVTLRCDRARRTIFFAREGQGTGAIVIRSSSAMKEFAGTPAGGTPPYIATEIAPGDPILDAMALSRGRIAINVAGQRSIAIPSWAEITRIVEDCRG
jgi:hypothetical protein